MDVLFRISRDRSVEHSSLREQILEVCLEYVGKRWRGDGEDMVGEIARKLTEIEFEVSTLLPGELTAASTARRPNHCPIGLPPHHPFAPFQSGPGLSKSTHDSNQQYSKPNCQAERFV